MSIVFRPISRIRIPRPSTIVCRIGSVVDPKLTAGFHWLTLPSQCHTLVVDSYLKKVLPSEIAILVNGVALAIVVTVAVGHGDGLSIECAIVTRRKFVEDVLNCGHNIEIGH